MSISSTETLNWKISKHHIRNSMSSSRKVIGSISEGLNEGEFDWVINVCSDATLKSLKRVISPTFPFASSPWHAIMQNYYSFEKEDEYIALYLSKEDPDVPNYVTISCNMTFLGMEVQKESTPCYFFQTSNNMGFHDYISRKQLLDLWTRSSKSCCQLIFRIRLRDHVPRDEDALFKVRLKEKEILSQNYKDLLLGGNDHDLVIKVKGKEFKTHRIIMQSRCPVFKLMLEHEMLEKNSGVVDIPDCDPAAFEQFLLYIYTGELEVLDESTMLGLYFIADKYDMENLRKESCGFIKKSLSVYVVCDVIRLACVHSDSALLEFATKYFVSNAKKIYRTVEWMSFMRKNPIIANELIIRADNKSSCCCFRASDSETIIL